MTNVLSTFAKCVCVKFLSNICKMCLCQMLVKFSANCKPPILYNIKKNSIGDANVYKLQEKLSCTV